jgi:hypothetical protein
MESKIYKFRSKKYISALKCTIETETLIDPNTYNITGLPYRENIVMYCPVNYLEELEIQELKEVHYGR